MHRLHQRCLQTEHHIRRQSAERKRIRARIRRFSHRVGFRCRCDPKHIGVIAQSANQSIITAVTGQRVVSAIPRQRIRQRVARQRVIARATNHIFKRAGGFQIQAQIPVDRLSRGIRQIDRNSDRVREREIQRVNSTANFIQRDQPQCVVGIEPISVITGTRCQ